MKTFAKTFSTLTLTFLCLFSAPQLYAGGNETDKLEIQLITSENMVRRGTSLLMDVRMERAGTTHLAVTDVNGREVWCEDISLAAGQNRVKFRVGDLRSGTYFLEVASGARTKTQAFAVR